MARRVAQCPRKVRIPCTTLSTNFSLSLAEYRGSPRRRQVNEKYSTMVIGADSAPRKRGARAAAIDRDQTSLPARRWRGPFRQAQGLAFYGPQRVLSTILATIGWRCGARNSHLIGRGCAVKMAILCCPSLAVAGVFGGDRRTQFGEGVAQARIADRRGLVAAAALFRVGAVKRVRGAGAGSTRSRSRATA